MIKKIIILKIFRLISINLLVLFGLLEVPARIYYNSYYSHESSKLIKRKETKDYLNYVNHIRNPSQIYSQKKIYLKPLNINKPSIYLYSKFSNCNDVKSCNTIILQGDSWGESLETNSADYLFSPYIKNGWRAYGMGISSFSPSNHSAQLGYLFNKKIYPRIVIAYIDQSDIGDEYTRYRSKVLPPTKDYPFYKVKNFGPTEHLNFYNYSTIKSPFSLYPLSPFFIFKLWDLSMQKIELLTGTFKQLSSTPRWRHIGNPLIKKDLQANNYFKKVLTNYINSAKELGVEELYLVSHLHYRHFYEIPLRYDTNVGDLLDEVIKNIQSSNDSIKIFHIKSGPRDLKCIEESCNGYYVNPDLSSHPTSDSYRKIGKEISIFIKNNSYIKP